MDNTYSIFRKEQCEICEGGRFVLTSHKGVIKNETCPHCDAKGYLRIIKDDY